jgi:hypothetical protein
MTVEELKNILFERGMRKTAVSFADGILTEAEQFCIQRDGRTFWEVYYYERGEKKQSKTFLDENSACLYLLSKLEKDWSVWVQAPRFS